MLSHLKEQYVEMSANTRARFVEACSSKRARVTNDCDIEHAMPANTREPGLRVPCEGGERSHSIFGHAPSRDYTDGQFTVCEGGERSHDFVEACSSKRVTPANVRERPWKIIGKSLSITLILGRITFEACRRRPHPTYHHDFLVVQTTAA